MLPNKGGLAILETILLVISRIEVRKYWETLLSNLDCAVITVEPNMETLARCPSIQPDLILLSDSAPNFMGNQIVRKIKSDARNRLVPVVLLNSTGGQIDFS